MIRPFITSNRKKYQILHEKRLKHVSLCDVQLNLQHFIGCWRVAQRFAFNYWNGTFDSIVESKWELAILDARAIASIEVRKLMHLFAFNICFAYLKLCWIDVHWCMGMVASTRANNAHYHLWVWYGFVSKCSYLKANSNCFSENRFSSFQSIGTKAKNSINPYTDMHSSAAFRAQMLT